MPKTELQIEALIDEAEAEFKNATVEFKQVSRSVPVDKERLAALEKLKAEAELALEKLRLELAQAKLEAAVAVDPSGTFPAFAVARDAVAAATKARDDASERFKNLSALLLPPF